MASTASKSPSEAMGKPASSVICPKLKRACAPYAAFSPTVLLQQAMFAVPQSLCQKCIRECFGDIMVSRFARLHSKVLRPVAPGPMGDSQIMQ